MHENAARLKNELLINNHVKAYFGDLWTRLKNWSLPWPL